MAGEQPNDSVVNADILDNFQYQPIRHADEIRVLHILPASDEPIFKCKLIPQRLNEDPDFTALSYTWGDADAKYAAVAYKTDVIAKTAIECGGAKFQITNNLLEALLILRDQHAVTAIWVDQVCINQEDASEKGTQIQLMEQIYAKAKLTYVWLGPEEDAAVAFPFIKDFAVSHQKELYGLYSQTSDDYYTGEPRFQLGTEGRRGEYYHWHHYTALPQAGSKSWCSLWDFFARPWFRRLWVIQEFIASKEVKVLAGSQECTGDELRWAAAYIDIHQLGHLLRYQPEMRRLRIPVDNCYNITNSIRVGKHEPLSYLLEQTRRFRATDLRDNIFALGGLCKTLEITPDYNLSVAEVFLNTATTLIKNHNNLDLLSQAHTPKDRDDIPSWVPDWSDIWRPPTLIQPPLSDSRLTPKPNDITFPTPSTLEVQGYALDTVTQFSSILHPDYFDSRNPAHTYLLHLFRELVKPLATMHTSTDSLLSSFYKTLIANYITRHVIDAGKKPDVFHSDWTDFHVRLVEAAGGVHDAFAGVGAELFARHAGEKCTGRRFFVTEGGRMGLGPGSLRQGDTVVVVVGCGVPFVIRREEDKGGEELEIVNGLERVSTGRDDEDVEHDGKSQGESSGNFESQTPTLLVPNEGGKERHEDKQDKTKGWILVGETYIHGLDEWLQSEDSKNLEEYKAVFTFI